MRRNTLLLCLLMLMIILTLNACKALDCGCPMH